MKSFRPLRAPAGPKPSLRQVEFSPSDLSFGVIPFEPARLHRPALGNPSAGGSEREAGKNCGLRPGPIRDTYDILIPTALLLSRFLMLLLPDPAAPAPPERRET